MTYQDKGYIWIEALTELIPEIEETILALTQERQDEISGTLDDHVSNSQDFMAPTPSSRDLTDLRYRDQIKSLEDEIERLTGEVRAYNDDIIRVKGGRHTSIDPLTKRVIIYDR